MQDIERSLGFEEIEIPEGRRQVDRAAVKRLAESIDRIGLRHPITVRRKRGESGKYILVAGLHRLEACRKLGREHVPATITSLSSGDARLWEIAENLHRADLTKLERDELVAEWVKIAGDEVLAQSEPKPSGGRPEGGVRAAARDLGIERSDARRAVEVASLSDEAKQAARETGMDNNRSAMLAAAKEHTPQAQAEKIVELSQRRPVPPSTWQDQFNRLWDSGTAADHDWARKKINAAA